MYKKKYVRIIVLLLMAVFIMPLLPLDALAATVIYETETVVNIESVDRYEGTALDNGHPAANMALRPGMLWTYRVTVPKEGEYSFILQHYASGNVGFDLKVNGKKAFLGNLPAGKVLKEKALSGTRDLVESTICNIHLDEGENTLTLAPVNNPYHVKLFILKALTPLYAETKHTEGAYKNHYLPCIIEGEDFDYGTVPSDDAGELYPNDYREDTHIRITENDGEHHINLGKGESADYTVNVEYSGVYAFTAGTPSMGDLDFLVDGTITAHFTLLGQNSANSESAEYVYFPKGEHTFTFQSVNSALSIDYFQLVSAPSEISEYHKIGKPLPKEKEEEVSEESERPVWKTLYVSAAASTGGDGSKEAPFASIREAKEYVRTIRSDMKGDIVVSIASGRYELSEPEIFTPEDSGQNGFYVVYRGESYENMPMVSGGKKIENWEPYNEHVYRADLSGLGMDVYNFYVDEKYAQKARSKYGYRMISKYTAEGSPYASDGLTVSRSNFPDHLTNIKDIQLVWTQEWTNHRTPLEDIVTDGEYYRLIARQPNWEISTTRINYAPASAGVGPFYIENAFELLDEPGEYYFNKETKMLYYYPEEGTNIYESECYAGFVEQMIRLYGDSLENKVSHIMFENLDMRHGEYSYYLKNGLVSHQAGCYFNTEAGENYLSDRLLEGQIDMDKADSIIIRKCKFIDMGSCAITMYKSVSNVKIDGNVFHDVAGEAVALGVTTPELPEGEEYTSHVDITNNVIRRAACFYMSSCQLTAYYANNIRILHNDIDDSPYTGISISWGWGQECKGASKFEVAYNYVKYCMLVMFDGSHFYCLGPLSGTKIHDNYFYKAGPRNITYKGAIYFDEGTRYIEAYNNVAEDFYALVGDREGASNSVHDNYTNSVYIGENERVVVNGENYVVRDGNWPDKAREIMANAGLEPEYKYILDSFRNPHEERMSRKVPSFVPKRNSIIWAADYLPGGEGVGYHDTSPKNAGGMYRSDDVDIWNSSTYTGRYDVGVDHGDWMKYRFDVPKSGEYTLKFWTCNSKSQMDIQPHFNFYCDDQKIIDNQLVTPTVAGNSSAYGYTDVQGIYLKEGLHEFKLEGIGNFFGITNIEFVDGEAGYLSPDYDEGTIVIKQKITFEDIEGHWARETIERLADAGIIRGINEREFAPERNLTANDAARLLLRVYNTEDASLSLEENAQKLRLFDGIWQREEEITREVFAKMVMNAYLVRKLSYNTSYSVGVFPDVGEVSDDALLPVLGAYKLGIMTGDPEGCFRPASKLTRAEAATVIERLKNMN